MNEKKSLSSVSLEHLLKLEPYLLTDTEKNNTLLPIIKEQLIQTKKNKHIKLFLEKQQIDISNINSLEEVPPLPVQMFKYFDLKTCSQSEIVKILKSSGTTTNTPSKIPLSKKTTLNQTKALKSILSNYLGEKRKIFIVIDHENINSPKYEFSARTAGVRGLSIYAKKIIYVLKEENGILKLNLDAINDLIKNYSNEDVYIFGFTYIIWSTFFNQIKKLDFNFSFRSVKIFHSGGWKKLKANAISKELFSKSIAKIFNTKKEHVIDFYGMAEQTGIIFVDCEFGNKHIPNFAQIIIRDTQTLKPCNIGEKGLIEVMSILSDSYYCQATLTEDIGVIIGIDDCPCGRNGRYFRFKSRVEKTEIRGCGDSFQEREV